MESKVETMRQELKEIRAHAQQNVNNLLTVTNKITKLFQHYNNKCQ